MRARHAEQVGDDEVSSPAESGTRRFGHSKDFRSDLPQVVIAMAVTRDGTPIRCWTFPGNTADTAIIRTVKDDLAGWNLRRMVWVADRGFASAANRAYLTRGGGHYIHAEKLRHTNTEAAAALARPGRFRDVADNLRVKEVFVSPGGGADDGARAERLGRWVVTVDGRRYASSRVDRLTLRLRVSRPLAPGTHRVRVAFRPADRKAFAPSRSALARIVVRR